MKVVIAAIGRMKQGPERSLMESYLSRLPWSVDIHEIETKVKGSQRRSIQDEAEKLISAIPKDSKIVCLDSTGKALTSEGFANQIREWGDDGVPSMAVLIGGPDGLSQQILSRADLKLSFGTVTWPHMLARIMLVEQLYRAHCILTNHPYHRGH